MKFLNPALDDLEPYVPGEQPRTNEFIKLNTNENPYPPAPETATAVAATIQQLQLYPDPTCDGLMTDLAAYLGVKEENVFLANGSDEVLGFCFQRLMGQGVAFPDITYGFYKVFAQMYGVATEVIPLQEDFTIDFADYQGVTGTIIFANPNAPTSYGKSLAEMEALVAADPERLVIVDEAYVEFGGETLVPLTAKYDNLLVVGTFSKAWQLAGARLGYAVGCPALMEELNRVKFSFNPYSINSMTMAAGKAALQDLGYHRQCLNAVIQTRTMTTGALEDLGFEVLPSQTNFLFAKHSQVAGEELYQRLKEHNVLVRWFSQDRIKDYIRITIGTPEQMIKMLEIMEVLR